MNKNQKQKKKTAKWEKQMIEQRKGKQNKNST